MDEHYRTLFSLMTQSAANIAEEVMEVHAANKEEAEYENAQRMRDDYLNLYARLTTGKELEKADYALLYISAFVVSSQLEARIEKERKTLEGYKLDILPKLDQVNNASLEEAIPLAEQLFKIKE